MLTMPRSGRSHAPRQVDVARRSITRYAAVLVVALVPGAVVLAASSADARPGRAATPECTNHHLSASYRGRDAATSHVRGSIVLTNVSNEPCWIRGYGGLSYVGRGNGTQIGAPADRTASKKPLTVVPPGDKVRSPLVERSAGAFPEKECQPRAVDGFRVYLPDQTLSQFVSHETTGCANSHVHLMAHKAYR